MSRIRFESLSGGLEILKTGSQRCYTHTCCGLPRRIFRRPSSSNNSSSRVSDIGPNHHQQAHGIMAIGLVLPPKDLQLHSGRHRVSCSTASDTRSATSGTRQTRVVVDEIPPGLYDSKGEKDTRRVLLAVDNSALSERAMDWAVDNLLCSDTDQLRLVHVVPSARCDHDESGRSTSGLSHSSITGSEEEEPQVFALPMEALEESWATVPRQYVKERFLNRLECLNLRYEVDLIKEYGPDSSTAIGHCICDAAEGLDASVVVVAKKEESNTEKNQPSVSNFVAHYCRRPVIVLKEREIGLYKTQMLPAFRESSLHLKGSQTSSASAILPSSRACRVLMFAVDESMIHTWALGWAVKALYHPGDQVHLVHVAKRRTDDIQRSLDVATTRIQSVGIASEGHLVIQALHDCDEDCEGVAKALVDLARELDAGMLFLVNNSDSHLEDFLHHSVTGQCLLKGSCPAVILHANKHEFGTDMEL